jgi:hypothetical protein
LERGSATVRFAEIAVTVRDDAGSVIVRDADGGAVKTKAGTAPRAEVVAMLAAAPVAAAAPREAAP